MGASTNIIQAKGSPPAQMSIFIAIRVTAAICLRARPSEPDMDTLHRPPVSGAGRVSLLVSKLGPFLPSTEKQGVLR